jgi:hypothetical protein
MKKWTLQILLVVALVALAFALRQRDKSRPPKRPTASEDKITPESIVLEFFDAASRGDDGAYLELTAGELRKSLENDRAELGADAFREELRRSASGVKGLAVMPADGSVPSGLAAVDVDHTFVDRIERQRALLKPQGKGWVIVSIQAAEMIKPPIPYGTPVFEEPASEPAEKEKMDRRISNDEATSEG